MKKSLLTIILAIFAVIGCGQKKNESVPEYLADIKVVVAQLDSSVNSLYGWEPQDSTYNHSVDTWVYDVLEQYKKERPNADIGVRSEYAIDQKTYDEARVVWAEFKRLCDADMYKEALDLYEGEGSGSHEKNSGYFLVHLKHSTHRFVFFSQVLLPLMKEYRDLDYAFENYINVLQLEKAMEDLAFDMSRDSSYFPEEYPNVVAELGFALTEMGRVQEAIDLVPDMIQGVFAVTGNALVANFNGTKFAAQIYYMIEQEDNSIAVFNHLQKYLEENRSDYDPDELAECLDLIDGEIAEIKGLAR